MRLTAVLTWTLAASVAMSVVSLPALAEEPRLPEVSSAAAVVLDLRTGAEVWGKDADDVRGIASTTKIFVAMVVRKKKIKLDGWTEITQVDVKAAKGGSRTRLDRGQSFKNVDLLRAMLMSSDNRAPTALGRAVGLSQEELVKEMNKLARAMGLKKTKFVDASGLRGNVSTAREMALALRAALEDDVIAEIMTTETARVVSKSGYAKIDYTNTNQPLRARKHKVTGGKTGFTTPAGYCFLVGAELGDRAYVMAFLGADGKQSRFVDFERVAQWIVDGAPGAKVAPKPAGKDGGKATAGKRDAGRGSAEVADQGGGAGGAGGAKGGSLRVEAQGTAKAK